LVWEKGKQGLIKEDPESQKGKIPRQNTKNKKKKDKKKQKKAKATRAIKIQEKIG